MDELNIEKFDPTVADLKQLVAVTSQVIVTDINDKAQIEEVKKNRIALRDARVSITKKGKELREGALKFQKAVIAKENELIAIIEPEEERLKAIEEEVKQKKLRAERIALLPERKKRLAEIGDGNDYSNDDELLIGMDAVEFQAFVNDRVAKKNELDAQKLKEREDAAKAEENRLAREKEMHEREEKAREEERQKAEQREKDRIEREAREKKEAEERAEREKKAEEERLERERKEQEANAKYQAFLTDHGYNEATKDKFHIEKSGRVVRIYMLTGEITLD